MSTTAKRLFGNNALITGGSTGIDLATAKRFVDEGAYVLITGGRGMPLMPHGSFGAQHQQMLSKCSYINVVSIVSFSDRPYFVLTAVNSDRLSSLLADDR